MGELRQKEMVVLPLLVLAALIYMPRSIELLASASEDVRLTQKYLVPVCVDGEPVKPGDRRLRLAPGQHMLAFTMRNSPRRGVLGRDVTPGIAVVPVALEAGHKYEVETRADATTYSTRVWPRGEWKPVVRDRTTERVVSAEPEWRDTGSACKP
jgi:hypothetical protein